jgi:hypothetical protein
VLDESFGVGLLLRSRSAVAALAALGPLRDPGARRAFSTAAAALQPALQRALLEQRLMNQRGGSNHLPRVSCVVVMMVVTVVVKRKVNGASESEVATGERKRRLRRRRRQVAAMGVSFVGTHRTQRSR